MSGFDLNSLPGGLSYAKLSQILADAGYVLPSYDQNTGTPFTGVSLRRTPMVSASRRLAVGLATKLFDYQFCAATQNTALWKATFSTMTQTQSAQGLLQNAISTLTTTTGCLLSTWRYFNLPGSGVLQIDMGVSQSVAPLTNQALILGLQAATTATATPTDGVYFKITAAGIFGVINFNGTETATAAFTATLTYPQVYNYRIDISNLTTDFFINDALMASLPSVVTNGLPANFAALPLAFQNFNPGTVVGTPMQNRVITCSVTQRDLATNKSWETVQAGNGLNASQGAEGQTVGTTALYSNNLAVGAGAAMTNTTAALGSGLGGQFTALPTLAVATDGILQSYQNPAGTINIPGRTLYIRGVWLQSLVTVALTGGPLYYAYSLAYGHTAVSVATAESASFATGTTKASRRIPLGMEVYLAAAVAGTLGPRIYQPFATPLAVNPGEFVAICAKLQLGSTVTTLGEVTWLVGYDAFFE